jgi:hypothetical protein
MSDWKSHVHPHGPLTQLSPRVWQVAGSLPRIPLPRNMTIWKMADGGLWVHSAVACDDATMDEIERLGRPEVLVVPNGFHRADAAVWKDRYPAMRVVCPEAARPKVEEVVKVDGKDTETVGVIVHEVPGIKEGEHVYEVDAGAGHALVMCDLLFNLPHLPGFGGFVLRMLGSTGRFGLTPTGKFLMVKDTRQLRKWLEEEASAPELSLICVGHGEPVLADPALKLKEAAERM